MDWCPCKVVLGYMMMQTVQEDMLWSTCSQRFLFFVESTRVASPAQFLFPGRWCYFQVHLGGGMECLILREWGGGWEDFLFVCSFHPCTSSLSASIPSIIKSIGLVCQCPVEFHDSINYVCVSTLLTVIN